MTRVYSLRRLKPLCRLAGQYLFWSFEDSFFFQVIYKGSRISLNFRPTWHCCTTLDVPIFVFSLRQKKIQEKMSTVDSEEFDYNEKLVRRSLFHDLTVTVMFEISKFFILRKYRKYQYWLKLLLRFNNFLEHINILYTILFPFTMQKYLKSRL